MASPGLWAARRSHGAGDAGIAAGYARAQASTAYAVVLVSVVETAGVSFMLASYPAAHLVVLLLELCMVFLALGLHAAVTRPHVVGPSGPRVRRGTRLDLRIPPERIASARHDLRFPDTNEPEDGVLDVAIASRTSITIGLDQPVTAVSLLGRRHHGPRPARCLPHAFRRVARRTRAQRETARAPAPSDRHGGPDAER